MRADRASQCKAGENPGWLSRRGPRGSRIAAGEKCGGRKSYAVAPAIVMPDYCATKTPSAFLPMRSIAFCAKPEAFMSAAKALAYSTTAAGAPFG